MKVTCPSCRKPIPGANLNAAANLAICAACNEAFELSALLDETAVADVDLYDPPRGAWFQQTFDGFQLGATTRSAMAFFLVPFMCVWSGGALGGIYGTQIAAGKFDLMLSLFGIPFLLGTLLFGSIAVMSVCGKVVVTIERERGSVFTGVGPIGWTRRFDWHQVEGVQEDFADYHNSRNMTRVVALVGPRPLKFGSMLSTQRRTFFLLAMRKLIKSQR